MTKTTWYRFRQNNSGGSFGPPAITVYVEARGSEEANERAKTLGVYFNGVDAGIDCECCGDSWTSGEPVESEPMHLRDGDRSMFTILEGGLPPAIKLKLGTEEFEVLSRREKND